MPPSESLQRPRRREGRGQQHRHRPPEERAIGVGTVPGHPGNRAHQIHGPNRVLVARARRWCAWIEIRQSITEELLPGTKVDDVRIAGPTDGLPILHPRHCRARGLLRRTHEEDGGCRHQHDDQVGSEDTPHAGIVALDLLPSAYLEASLRRWIMPEVETTLERRLSACPESRWRVRKRARRCLGTGTDRWPRSRFGTNVPWTGSSMRSEPTGPSACRRGQFCPTTPRSSVWDCPQERRGSARSIIWSGSPARTRWALPLVLLRSGAMNAWCSRMDRADRVGDVGAPCRSPSGGRSYR